MVTIPGGKLLGLTQLTFFISPEKHDICKWASQILQLKNTISYVYRGKDGPNSLIYYIVFDFTDQEHFLLCW